MKDRRRAAVVVAVVLVGLLAAGGWLVLSRTEDAGTCVAAIAPVDADATPAAVCVAATLDRWQAAGVMGIGQQVDVQEAARMRQPLESLEPLRPALVGFDFDELLNAQDFFGHDPVPYLAGLAHDGLLLSATWHPDNPVTGGRFDDRAWSSLEDLLDPSSAASQSFWPEYDRVLAQARRLQDEGVAVIFKPLHEASGNWFWWGAPDRSTYRSLFAQLQARAYASGVHNLLWAYAANPQRYEPDGDPLALLPEHIDLAGLDVYDDPGATTLTVTDVQRLAAVAPRMALTEVGPRGDSTGEWSPRVITDTLRVTGLYAVYAMLWRDDPAPGNVYQVSSLTGGPEWLSGCPEGLCVIIPQ